MAVHSVKISSGLGGALGVNLSPLQPSLLSTLTPPAARGLLPHSPVHVLQGSRQLSLAFALNIPPGALYLGQALAEAVNISLLPQALNKEVLFKVPRCSVACAVGEVLQEGSSLLPNQPRHLLEVVRTKLRQEQCQQEELQTFRIKREFRVYVELLEEAVRFGWPGGGDWQDLLTLSVKAEDRERGKGGVELLTQQTQHFWQINLHCMGVLEVGFED